MSFNNDLGTTLTMLNTSQLVKLQKEERKTSNIVFSVFKTLEGFVGNFEKDSKTTIRAFLKSEKDFKEARIESVTAIEYKELFLKTENALKDVRVWIEGNHQGLLNEVITEDIELDRAKQKASEEALVGYISGVLRRVAYLLAIAGGVALVLLVIVLVPILFLLGRCSA